MTENPTESDDSSSSGEIDTEINTDRSYDGKGTVYAVLTVREGDRRVDWKVGHIDGTFAEGVDYYYKGELVHSDELHEMHENAPLGRYKDEKFHELLDSDISIEDEKLIEKKVYDVEGVDTDEWATNYLDGKMLPETLLEEWWEDMRSRYDESKFS